MKPSSIGHEKIIASHFNLLIFWGFHKVRFKKKQLSSVKFSLSLLEERKAKANDQVTLADL